MLRCVVCDPGDWRGSDVCREWGCSQQRLAWLGTLNHCALSDCGRGLSLHRPFARGQHSIQAAPRKRERAAQNGGGGRERDRDRDRARARARGARGRAAYPRAAPPAAALGRREGGRRGGGGRSEETETAAVVVGARPRGARQLLAAGGANCDFERSGFRNNGGRAAWNPKLELPGWSPCMWG